jgi:hypothetical protein
MLHCSIAFPHSCDCVPAQLSFPTNESQVLKFMNDRNEFERETAFRQRDAQDVRFQPDHVMGVLAVFNRTQHGQLHVLYTGADCTIVCVCVYVCVCVFVCAVDLSALARFSCIR